jgi:hypothetical protein
MDPIIITSNKQKQSSTETTEYPTTSVSAPIIIHPTRTAVTASLVPGADSEIIIPKWQKPPSAAGRPAKHKEFPLLVNTAKDFIESHGYSAQSRRRSNVAQSSGVSLRQIQKHVLDNVDGLSKKGVSINTVHHLLAPPNKKCRSAKLYKGLIGARVPGKSNKQIPAEHPDFHFTAAQVNYICEMMSSHDEETLVYSADDKNKVNVGTLAVSRYHQISAIYPTDDAPDYPDHDFPYPNSKIIPSGYMRLEKPLRSRSQSPENTTFTTITKKRSKSLSPTRHNDKSVQEFKRDKHGRLHIIYPRTGTLHVYNYPGKFHSTTSMTHSRDLKKILQSDILRENKAAVAVLCDNGPDWSFKSQLTIFYMGRLWRDMDLDYLTVCSYAPRHSAFNMIEHAWSKLSKLLVGVTLSAMLPGEDRPPFQQKLSEQELHNKEALVFDKAVDDLNSYWSGETRTYDGFRIQSEGVKCIDSNLEADKIEYEKVKKFFKMGKKNIEPHLQSLQKEHTFFTKHCCKRTYVIEFLKCTDPECSHCAQRPIRAKKLVNFLRSCGGHSLVPVPSPTITGSYKTYLEFADAKSIARSQISVCSTVSKKPGSLSQVCHACSRYIFSSATDQKRHLLFCDANMTGAGGKRPAPKQKCSRPAKRKR